MRYDRSHVCFSPSAPLSRPRAVLEIIKSAQAQNGLRHNDYERYRQYCTRRLARIRHAPAVQFTHGKKKFLKRDLTAGDCTDPRHLQIPLVQAERAWAQAMSQKQDEAGLATADARHHLVCRLRKAAKHGDELVALCGARGDVRTSLEAEAYACWLHGVLGMELEEWQPALDAFSRARSIYEQLAKVAARRSRELYQQRVEELAPNERFCRYHLVRKAGRAGGAAAAAASSAAAPGGGELDAKIAAALALGGGAGGSGSSSSSFATVVVWRRTTLPVRADKLRAALGAAAAKSVQLAALVSSGEPGAVAAAPSAAASGKGGAGTESVYLEVLARYDEAARLAGEEANRAAKEGKGTLAGDFAAIGEFARFCRARHSLDRFEMLAAAAAGELDKPSAQPAGAAAAGPNAFASHPWLAAVMGGSAGDAVTGAPAGGKASRAAAAAAVSAATQAAALYARSVKALDEMIGLCGGAAGAAGAGTGGAEGGASPASPRDGAAPAGGASAGDLPADEALAAALSARRAGALAHRCWYVALSYARARRYADATALLARAGERASAALDAYASLGAPGSPSLPPSACALTHEEPGVDSSAVLSGVSSGQADALSALAGRMAQQGVALRATALLESLAARARPDRELLEGYAAAFAGEAGVGLPPKSRPAPPAASLARGPRPAHLLDRLDQGAALAPTADPASVAPWPPAGVAAPVKPLLFDLAFAGLGAYPDELAAPAPAASPVKAPAAAAGAAPSTPGKAPAPSAGGSGTPGSARVGPSPSTTPAKAAAAAAPAAEASPSAGSGLLGWFTGR